MNVTFVVQKPVHPRLEYTIDFINHHPLKPKNLRFTINNSEADIHITYGTGLGEILIPAQDVLFSSILTPIDFECNTYAYEDEFLYSVEKMPKPHTSSFFQNNAFGFDILEMIFFHISRYEEVVCKDNNPKNGWMREEEHFLVRNELEKIPVVDRLLHVFFEIVSGERINHKTTFSMSHDIDVLFRYRPWHKTIRSIFAMVYHRRGWNHFKKSIRQIVSGEDPYDTYEWLLRTEPTLSPKRIYFMTGGETRKDNLYNPYHPKMKEIIELAMNRGYEIGIHPSYNAALKEHLFVDEKKKLEHISEQAIQVSRQHWLHWDWEKTPNIIHKNGIKHDSSIGYTERIGFRCGTGFAYNIYNFTTELKYEWVELPLAFMESSLIYESTRTGCSIEEVGKLFFEKNVLKTHINMNWHNTAFDESTAFGQELKLLFFQATNLIQ